MKTRNESMDVCKFIASILVLFSHVPFPAGGQFVDLFIFPALGMFFAISGYFAFGAKANLLKKRMLHLIKLNIIADCVHIFYRCVAVELRGGSTIAELRAMVPDLNELMNWIACQQNSFLGHLWFLPSLFLCYGLLWLMVKGIYGQETPKKYWPMYVLGIVAGMFYLVLELLLPVTDPQLEISYLLTLNGWIFGLANFAFGLMCRAYQERFVKNLNLSNRKLAAIFCGGVFLGGAQNWGGGYGGGNNIGMLLMIPALLLFLIQNPRIPGEAKGLHFFARHCGLWSTAIYLLHITVASAYRTLLSAPMKLWLGDGEAWLAPMVVLLFSFLGALLWDGISSWLHCRRKGARAAGKQK